MTTLVEGEVLLLKLSNSLEAEPALIGRGIDLVIPPEHRVFSFDFDQSRPLAALRDALPELFNGLDKEKLNPQNPRAWLSVLRSFQRLRDQTVESVLQIYGLEDFLELSSAERFSFITAVRQVARLDSVTVILEVDQAYLFAVRKELSDLAGRDVLFPCWAIEAEPAMSNEIAVESMPPSGSPAVVGGLVRRFAVAAAIAIVIACCAVVIATGSRSSLRPSLAQFIYQFTGWFDRDHDILKLPAESVVIFQDYPETIFDLGHQLIDRSNSKKDQAAGMELLWIADRLGHEAAQELLQRKLGLSVYRDGIQEMAQFEMPGEQADVVNISFAERPSYGSEASLSSELTGNAPSLEEMLRD